MNMFAVELIDIRKSFGGFVALDNVSFKARYGEVHALLGENGAGKSSLMNIAAGLYSPEAGTILINGLRYCFSGPRDAVKAGIGMIHQHFKLVEKFSVLENIMLALAVNSKPRAPYVSTKIKEIAKRLHTDIDPLRIVGTMSVAERQRVEIIKALALGSRILILDEPTAVLTEKEASSLYAVMAEIAASGTCVIIVTHKLSDVRAVANEATVMRQGKVVAIVDPKITAMAELTMLTVGTSIPEPRRSLKPPGQNILRIQSLFGDGGSRVPLHDTSFEVRAGEIYGIAGVGGNGQTELVDALSGVGRIDRGEILIASEKGGWFRATALTPAQRLKLGFAWIPADRQAYALAARLSVQDNYALAHIRGGIGSPLWVNRSAVKQLALQAVASANIQGVRKMDQWVGLLSGGNAQKLVVARELSHSPKFIVAHSPCRGLDARASATVQERLVEARDSGIAVILISEDLDEVLAIADRIGVMSAGKIVAEFEAPADRQAIGDAMMNHA